MNLPNADLLEGPEYLADLIGSLPENQAEVAQRIGVTDRTLRAWLAGKARIPYTAQFTLEYWAIHQE